jgi:hypothetical protein
MRVSANRRSINCSLYIEVELEERMGRISIRKGGLIFGLSGGASLDLIT